MGTVHLRHDGAIARIVFDNPPHNCLTTAMFEQLGRHVRGIEDDPDVRVALLAGEGDHLYTVGADIREMDVHARREDRRGETDRWLGQIHDVLGAIEGSSKVFICAMKGISYGGGLEIAAACDIRVASQEARFAMPEVKLGIIPGYGGTQRLRKLIGLGHALALILGAQEIDAEAARQWGLVDIVTAAGEAEATALLLARRIAGHAPLALAAAKRAIRDGGEMQVADGLARERAYFIDCAASSDFDEGRRAFLEKRAPQFHGV